ncbi:hypothetical protein SNE40_015222 [Patella caerulea]|uniref:Uncharacterized protein n=2 Tax=Patella caerulea TaxID=87958 RepID=A0AAN8JJI5_PATCE
MKQRLFVVISFVFLGILCIHLIVGRKKVITVDNVQGPIAFPASRKDRDHLSTQNETMKTAHSKTTKEHTTTHVQTTTIQPNPICIAKQKNIVFLKVHKCGSSTVANILQRYTYNNHLNPLLPDKDTTEQSYWVLNRLKEQYMSQIIPIPEGESYNTMFVHSVHDHDIFKRLFPNNSYYVAILRDPVERFISYTFYYQLVAQMKEDFPQSKHNPYIFSKALLKKPFPYGVLGPSYDLGFRPWGKVNETVVDRFIDNIDKDYDFVMIMEYFDESLVYLRHKLCWDIKDILYIKKNVNYEKKGYALSQKDRQLIKAIQPVDVPLYDYFYKQFWNILKSQHVSFFEEVYNFKQILSGVADYCNFGRKLKPEGLFAKTQWHDAFNVTSEDCNQMKWTEGHAIAMLAKKARDKYKNSKI